MNAIADFAPPDTVAALRAIFASSTDRLRRADEIRQRVDGFVFIRLKLSAALRKIVEELVRHCEVGDDDVLELLDSEVYNIQVIEGRLSECLRALQARRSELLDECEVCAPEYVPSLSIVLSRITVLDTETAGALRDARWRLMAARAKAFPGDPIGAIHGDVAGMDDYLNSVP